MRKEVNRRSFVARKMVAVFLMVMSLTIWGTSETAWAHPGRTDANGGHTCRTNCEKWGLQYGEYHYHNGGGARNNDAPASNNANQNTPRQPATVNQPVVPKSSDTSLKSVTVNDEVVGVADEMYYTTFDERVNVVAEVNDGKASYEIKNKSLTIGENTIGIVVKAEDGSTREYNLIVKREKLSDNTNLEVVVQGKSVEFSNGEARVELDAETEELDYEYHPEDEKAKVRVDGSPKLEVGDNLMKFVVTAQDGTEKVYTLTLHKQAKQGDGTMGTVLGAGVAGCAVYGVYKRSAKKPKK